MKLSPLHKIVLGIAAPAVVELVLTSLTSLADTVMVGKLGSYAITAVGLTNQPRFVMLAVFVALNVGATALVARFRGQDDKASADIVTVQTIFLTVALAVLLTIPGVLFAEPMVRFMGAEEDVVKAGAAYFSILMIGFIPTALPIAISALLRGVGETKISLRYNVAANIVNIVFNYLLIYGKWGFPQLGVTGAAVATVIGNGVSCAMALYAIAGKRFHRRRGTASDFIELRLSRWTVRPHWPMLGRIVRIGLPSAGEQFALRTGLLVYTKTISSLGTDVFAAHQIVLTILNLSFVNGQAFGIAATSLTGQALGRKSEREAVSAAAAARRIGSIISTGMGILMFLFRRELMALFTDNSAIIELGAAVIILAALVQPFQASFQIYAGALRGAGDSLYPALSLAVGILVIRPLLALLLVRVFTWGLFGAWLALFLDQTIRFFLLFVRFRRGKWLGTQV